MTYGIVLVMLTAGLLAANPNNPENQNNPNNPEDSRQLDRVPAESLEDFLLYYQDYLQRRSEPPDIGDGDREDTAAKLLRQKSKRDDQRSRALLCARLAANLSRLADDPDLPENAECFVDEHGQALSKDKSKKIRGTWNLYRGIPPNAADLWEESCFLRYRAFLHDLDADSIDVALQEPGAERKEIATLELINGYAARVREHKRLESLYLEIKRVWLQRSLKRIEKSLETAQRSAAPGIAPPEIRETLESDLVKISQDYGAFLSRYPFVENIERSEAISVLNEKLKSDTVSESLDALYRDCLEQARRIPSKNADESHRIAHRIELLETFRGVLRRERLLGKPLPIRGVQVLIDADGKVVESGEPFDGNTLKGKVVLLDFWATWCGPCIAEFPHLKMLYAKYREKGFEIIGYNVDSDKEKLYTYLRGKPVPWPVLSKELSRNGTAVFDSGTGGEVPLSTYLGARRLPVVLLRDRDGKTVLLDARGQALDEMLKRLLGDQLR
ncbi:MAG TPA: hypothetical protein DEB39_11520 [Planctomycetaceae bacterium]|nr:hypothetical protein [Planctomycetaceae bacterium]